MDTPQIIQCDEFRDHRGVFAEIFNAAAWEEKGIRFVTENYSWSGKNVFRGLHYQTVNPQGKLVFVAFGTIIDFAVDVREGSVGFGNVYSFPLYASDRQQIWIPPGFAHGYWVLSARAIVMYLATQYRHPESEVVVRCNDPALKLQGLENVVLSEKDKYGLLLKDAPRIKV